jgi:hypothetical protein
MLHCYCDFAVDKDIVGLSVLKYVWDDLMAGQDNWYFRDLSLDNIEQEVIEKAKKWMREN